MSTYIGFLSACIFVLPPLLAGALWWSARRDATKLGGVEIDGVSIRWRKPDSTLGFDVPWAEIERATADARKFTLVLTRRSAEPVIVAALAPNGLASDQVVLERFDELVHLVESRVLVSGHKGGEDSSAAADGAHRDLDRLATLALREAARRKKKLVERDIVGRVTATDEAQVA